MVSRQTPNMRLMPGRKPLELFFQVGLEWGGQNATAVSGQLELLWGNTATLESVSKHVFL